MRRLRWTLLTIGLVIAGIGAVAAQVRTVPALLINTVEAVGRPANVDPLRIVERLMSFDADLDDRVRRDELPERMQTLFERADKNRDGFLSKDEIRTAPAGTSPARRVIRLRTGPDEGLSGVISDLKLPPAKHEQALAIVAGDPSTPRNVNDANTDVNARLRKLLDDGEYENFVAAAKRLSRNPAVVFRGTVGGVVVIPPPPPPR